MNIDSFSRNIRSLVAFFIIFCGFGILFSIIFWDFPSDQKDIYYSISGVIGTLLGLVVSYYFGASKSETNHESNNSNTNKQDTTSV